MNFCKNCNNLSPDKYCQICGNSQVEEVAPDDFCFLTDCDNFWGDTLKETLTLNEIEFVAIPFGDGTRSKFALKLDRYKFFIAFKHYQKALDILNLFSKENTSEILKTQLIENFDKWHIKSKSTDKKLKKELNSTDENVFENLKILVQNATKFEDKGELLSFGANVHGIMVKTEKLTLWFSSNDYEILI